MSKLNLLGCGTEAVKSCQMISLSLRPAGWGTQKPSWVWDYRCSLLIQVCKTWACGWEQGYQTILFALEKLLHLSQYIYTAQSWCFKPTANSKDNFCYFLFLLSLYLFKHWSGEGTAFHAAV